MTEDEDAGASGEPPEDCSRRYALNLLVGAGAALTGASVAVPVAGFLLPPEQTEAAVASVVAGKVSDFPLNSGKIFKMGSKPGLLVRLADGTFRAYSAVCTHLSCRVQYRPDTKLIWCACHNGTFDLTGKNIAGPPPRPLETFSAKVLGGEVVVSREPS